MTLPILIAGLILEIAGTHWFSGAATVGWILIAVGAVPLLLMLGVFLIGLIFIGLDRR